MLAEFHQMAMVQGNHHHAVIVPFGVEDRRTKADHPLIAGAPHGALRVLGPGQLFLAGDMVAGQV